jgi:hypothetical protein
VTDPGRRPDPGGGDLDGLLAAWADGQRLEPAAVETMRTAIVAEPRELSATWWATLGTQVGDAITQATRASSAAFDAIGWAPSVEAT